MPLPASPSQPSAKASTPYIATETYQRVGGLTAAHLINGRADDWVHLDPKIEELLAFAQERVTREGRADDAARAPHDPEVKAQMTEWVDRLLMQYLAKESFARKEDRIVLVSSIINEIVGLGAIEPLWMDHRITEVMVNGPDSVFVEVDGRLLAARGARFRSQEQLLALCQRILAPLNRRVDQSSPMADGRLPDGSRVNIVHHSVSPGGPLLTIRRFPDKVWTLMSLVESGSIPAEMATELAFLVNHKASLVVVGGTGSGKALDVDTLVPSPSGFMRMGDLVVGDTVFDDQGDLTRVEGVFDQSSGRECFEVEFSDGSTVVADADHNWWTETRGRWRGQVVTTRGMADTLRTGDGLLNHRVPVVGGVVKYAVKEQPVDPYRAGMWWAHIHAVQVEVVADVVDGFDVVDGLGMAGIYLFGDEQQRRRLLSGILDVAGRCGADSYVMVDCVDELFAHHLRTLVNSLGYHAEMMKLGAVSGGVDGGPCFRVTFSAADDVFGKESLNRVHRVGRRQRCAPYERYRYVTRVRAVPERPMRCITVDSPSHLFLCTDNYIPTHNTSLLNALSSCIPVSERVVTVEDSLELRLHPKAHVAAMEGRPAGVSGHGEVRIRDLVKNALRMRPDRIVVGEVRDSAALDMLQAMNTGHEGSMTTLHANGAAEAMTRLSVLVAQGGEIPEDKVQWLIGDALDLVVLQTRYEDGSRRVSGLYEIPSMRENSGEMLQPIPLWEWEQTDTDEDGRYVGRYVKKNNISERLIRLRRLDQFDQFTLDDVRRFAVEGA